MNKIENSECNKVVVKDLLKKIKVEGERVGCSFITKKTMGRNTYVIGNIKSNKIILVGQTREKIIKFYKVNVNKWKWAESEGFSADNIVADLFDEIFVEIKTEHPISSCEIATKIINKLR